MATAKKSAPRAPAKKTAAAPTAPATRKVAAAPKTATAKVAPAAKVVKSEKPARVEKPRKPKLVRDSFTIPKNEYLVLEVLKQRAVKNGTPAKKSEILRAGIKVLAAMGDAAFAAALGAVPAVKTGRPAAN